MTKFLQIALTHPWDVVVAVIAVVVLAIPGWSRRVKAHKPLHRYHCLTIMLPSPAAPRETD